MHVMNIAEGVKGVFVDACVRDRNGWLCVFLAHLVSPPHFSVAILTQILQHKHRSKLMVPTSCLFTWGAVLRPTCDACERVFLRPTGMWAESATNYLNGPGRPKNQGTLSIELYLDQRILFIFESWMSDKTYPMP